MPHEQGKSQPVEDFVRGTREEIIKKPGYGLNLLGTYLKEYHRELDEVSAALYRNEASPADAARAWRTAKEKYSTMQVVEVPITVKTDAELEVFKTAMRNVSQSAPRGSYEFDVSQSSGVVTIKLKAAAALAGRIELEYERQKGESVKATIAEGVEKLRVEKEELDRQKTKLQRWNSLEGLPAEFVEYLKAEAPGENIQINEYLARKEVVDRIGALKTIWERYTTEVRPHGSLGRVFSARAGANIFKFIYENPEGATQAISELVQISEALGGLTGGERKVLYRGLNVSDDEIYQKPASEVLQKSQTLKSKPRSDKLGRGWARLSGYQAGIVEEFLRENSGEDAAVVLEAEKRKGLFRYDFDSAVADEFAEKFSEFYTRKRTEQKQKRAETRKKFTGKVRDKFSKAKKSYTENLYYRIAADLAIALEMESTAVEAALSGNQPVALGFGIAGAVPVLSVVARFIYNKKKMRAARRAQSAAQTAAPAEGEVVFESVVEGDGPAIEVEPEYVPNFDTEKLRIELLRK